MPLLLNKETLHLFACSTCLLFIHLLTNLYFFMVRQKLKKENNRKKKPTTLTLLEAFTLTYIISFSHLISWL